MRVLILSASTGGGHKKAASALKKTILAKDPNAHVEIIDALECVGHVFNKTVSDGYVFMAKKTPKLYGTVYDSTNRETSLNSMVSKVIEYVSKKLFPIVKEFNPDVIVSVHPFATEMASTLKGINGLTIPLISIVTDFAPHKTYVTDYTDCYIVSSEEMISSLEDFGVSKNKIHSLGIPIDMLFYEKQDKLKLMEEKELNPNIPTILIMAGSFGVTDILDIYKNIVSINETFQIVVITGKNIKLYESFEKLLGKTIDEEFPENDNKEILNKFIDTNDPISNSNVSNCNSKGSDYSSSIPSSNRIKKVASQFKEQVKDKTEQIKTDVMDKAEQIKTDVMDKAEQIKTDLKETPFIQKLYRNECTNSKPTKLLFFVDDVYKYMAIADLIITKPGGLTVTEALASTLPMAIFKAYPGQEAQNAEFLIKNNMAIWLPEKEGCSATIETLLKDPEKLLSMKKACQKFCKQQSADNIYKLIEELIASNNL